MADQDEYEPLARKWKSEYERYVGDTNSTCQVIADSALRTVAQMLRNCGGCQLFSQMTDLLWQNQLQLLQDTIFSEASNETLMHVNEELNTLAKDVANLRIEMVAIRSSRTVAVQLCMDKIRSEDCHTLQHQLAAQIIKDLIRHSFLDKARAFSVGRRFQNGAEAHQFYDDVMASIEYGMGSLVKQFVRHPDGEHLRYYSQYFKKRSTSSMLYDSSLRMDM